MFAFHDLFRALIRRLSLLAHFHGDTPWEPDFKALVQEAKVVAPLSSDLAWREWTRYSSRQRTAMQMGGVTGTCTFDALPQALWEPLWQGQWFHAGKSAVMGFGHYRIA
ncbi:MAG: CRISPR system precrRNA processing endoribonuclease RAMP protein Cas6 [Gammaproteobacteria bacterium]|nr:MAG: CRISPR system precrRNA processing endoribonuclease RAMP protein Cas6 [Gammaproteobacteria bacterium]